MRPEVLERIADRTISESLLRSELDRQESVTEPPLFWIDIANDPTFPAIHRAIALCQFFKRHLKKPIPLVDLARLLKSPDWIQSGRVTTVNHLKGEIPVEWNLGETVLAIRLFPGEIEEAPVLYLRLSQSLEAEAFVHIVRAPLDGAAAAGVSVLEAACTG